jgi:hypothetical protein
VEQTDTNLFAGAAFSLNKNGNVRLRNALQFISDSLHCGSLPENNVEWWEIESSNGFGVVNQDFFPIVVEKAQIMQCPLLSTLITNPPCAERMSHPL